MNTFINFRSALALVIGGVVLLCGCSSSYAQDRSEQLPDTAKAITLLPFVEVHVFNAVAFKAPAAWANIRVTVKSACDHTHRRATTPKQAAGQHSVPVMDENQMEISRDRD
ncbi:MAG: hypothetical protein JST22_21540 [Bacteroidetes bacterium]|nr:hypothetical protein [Bacteroidota bacterium]